MLSVSIPICRYFIPIWRLLIAFISFQTGILQTLLYGTNTLLSSPCAFCVQVLASAPSSELRLSRSKPRLKVGGFHSYSRLNHEVKHLLIDLPMSGDLNIVPSDPHFMEFKFMENFLFPSVSQLSCRTSNKQHHGWEGRSLSRLDYKKTMVSSFTSHIYAF